VQVVFKIDNRSKIRREKKTLYFPKIVRFIALNLWKISLNVLFETLCSW